MPTNFPDSSLPISDYTILRIVQLSGVDTNTILRYIAGSKSLRPVSKRRIKAAISTIESAKEMPQ